jgi:[CysO sulfur-carrier protein]-S-L-cysteine hydrolase
MYINKEALELMFQHALEEYPYECCGIITGDEIGQIVHCCENIQNKLHDEDPGRYPRDARTAYLIDRKKFEKIVSTAKTQGKDIIAFYHSHPEHESFFSEEDVAAQTVFGEPEFPDVLHVVISVMNRRVYDIKCFKWDREKKEFMKAVIEYK